MLFLCMLLTLHRISSFRTVGSIHSIGLRMMASSSSSFPTMKGFLQEQLAKHRAGSEPSYHLFVGNEAADADSIVSAVCGAYLHALRHPAQTVHLPLIAVPRDEFALRREVEMLLHKADITWDDILSVHELQLPADSTVRVTLLDHNAATSGLLANLSQPLVVDEIIDHHLDQMQYPYLPSEKRCVAFSAADCRAEVASTCTLLAERLLAMNPAPKDCAQLLAGVILLDTVNFNAQMKKATPRDVAAMSGLQGIVPIDSNLFHELNNAKTDLSYWRSLSVSNALKFDYKGFEGGGRRLGMSSVLLPLDDLLRHINALEDISKYIEANQLDVLVLMSIYTDEASGRLSRELGLMSRHEQLLSDLLDHLTELDQSSSPSSLQLQLMRKEAAEVDGQLLHMTLFQQGRLEASRKQVAPLLTDYLQGLRSTV